MIASSCSLAVFYACARTHTGCVLEDQIKSLILLFSVLLRFTEKKGKKVTRTARSIVLYSRILVSNEE